MTGGLPAVAIVGRPNVGKSTLFNRIVGAPRALVDDSPGVTRDRLVATADWLGRRFRLIDTGGFEVEPGEGLPARVRQQSLRAVEGADLVLFVVDGRAGLSPADVAAARFLAATGSRVLCVVNKIDGPKLDDAVYEFFQLGLGEPVGVSAELSRQIDELLDRLIAELPAGTDSQPVPTLRVAIVGRPNVGKSSILNRLLGEERVVVDSAGGTTRDAIDTLLETGGMSYLLVDTAGIRRRSRIDAALERASVVAALRSLDRAEVALLVVDAGEGVTDQDARIARRAWDRARGLVLVVNKWDTLCDERRDRPRFVEDVRRRYHHLRSVPAVVVSALRGTHLEEILPAARRVGEAFRTRIPTRRLNDVLGEAVAAAEPPLRHGKRPRFYYAAAVATAPPAVTLFVNDPSLVTTAYLRYLENRIRDEWLLEGVPLRIILRARARQRRAG